MADSSASVQRQVQTYFLGPHAENVELLEAAFAHLLDQHVAFRSPTDQTSPVAYQDSDLSKALQTLLVKLRPSIPFHSVDYVAHQLSDVSIPALAGAFIGLLHNANNVTNQTGTITTDIELDACDRLLEMIGFAPDEKPWCHLTSGGSVANIEALWAARDVLYLPLSIQEASALLDLKLPGTELDRSSRPLELLNLNPSFKLTMLATFVRELASQAKRQSPKAVAQLLTRGDPEKASRLTSALTDLKNGSGSPTVVAELALRQTSSSRWNGYGDAHSRYPPVVLVAESAHYSIEKAVSVLGIGADNLWTLPVDKTFRLHMPSLRDALTRVRAEGRFVLAVVANIGSTQEGAVDPLDLILTERENGRPSFWVHADAAWGGYLATAKASLRADPRRAVEKLAEADSVTVDPHKMGYLPYPGGAIAFRDDAVRFLLRHHAPYIVSPKRSTQVVEPIRKARTPAAALGPYTLEGSRPSFPALALKLSTDVLPLTGGGHGQIVTAVIKAARRINRDLSGVASNGHQLVSLLEKGPDSSLLLFGVRKNGGGSQTRECHNTLVQDIQDHLEGRKRPIYVSITTYSVSEFGSLGTVMRIAEAANITQDDSLRNGIDVLRLSVMNPYLAALSVEDLIAHTDALAAAFTVALRNAVTTSPCSS